MASNEEYFDVAIVGAGILGLAHAWVAIESGQKVVLFERERRAHGASIRNFGMVWPVGQPQGELFELAMHSRSKWLQLRKAAGIWAEECGSLHLVREEDELAVIEEYVQQCENSGLQVLSPDETIRKSAAVNASGLLGSLWSPTELCVNPKNAIHQIADWLVESKNLDARFGTSITEISAENDLISSTGAHFRADRIVVCSGSDFETLFPRSYSEAGLKKCKLQMMSTVPQNGGWQLGPHIAGGLTLRHYHSFKNCPSLQLVRDRIADSQPELDEFGIHVMAAMNDSAEVILGDSHLYDEEITPFDSVQIDDLILAEIQKLIHVPNLEIQKRWHGIYAKHPDHHIVELEPQNNCKIVTAPGGAGMTLSFGIANQTFERWT